MIPPADAPRLFGYASRFSAMRGETITFHVSAERVERYAAQLVRLRSDLTTPPGFQDDPVAASCDGTYPGHMHAAACGSSVAVTDARGMLRADERLELSLRIYATGGIGREQYVAGIWSLAAAKGYALLLVDGALVFRIGDGSRTVDARAGAPLPLHAWFDVRAGWDRSLGEAWIVHEPCGARGDRVLPSAAALAGGSTRIPARTAPAYDGCPFRIAAASAGLDRPGVTGGHFNGKIENPTLTARAAGLEATAAWDFGASRRADGLLLDAVVERSGEFPGTVVNQPTRSVTSSAWDGTREHFRAAPEQYAAIHFHEDDVDDVGWPAAFAFTVPGGLPSGVYAMRLTAGEAQEHIPFFVRAPRAARKRLAVLFPTGSYLAYANDHLPFDAAGAEVLIGHVPVLHADDLDLQLHYDFGRSCYEVHTDGSGVVFSSRRRPILNMRPGYRAWFMAEGPWQLPGDLAIAGWLDHERIAWDAITDEDLHRDGLEALEGYDAIITGSHPEYVSTRELDALETYVSRGGRLMYLGGNGFYWRVSYHPDKPYLMEVRRSANGSRPHQSWPGEQFHATSGERCGLWRDKGRAPQRLVGVGFAGEGFDRSHPYVRLPDSFDPRAAFAFEGVSADGPIGDYGAMGGGAAGAEIDRYDPELGSPRDALLLACSVGHSDDYQRASEELLETPPGTGGSQDPDVRADMVLSMLDGGGAVFSTGSIAWTASLSHAGYRNDVARITGNVLRRFLDEAPLA